jgi:hypothetical protein
MCRLSNALYIPIDVLKELELIYKKKKLMKIVLLFSKAELKQFKDLNSFDQQKK